MAIERLGPEIPLAVGAASRIHGRPRLPNRFDEAQVTILPIGRGLGRRRRGKPSEEGRGRDGSDGRRTGRAARDDVVLGQIAHALLGRVERLSLFGGHFLADILVPVEGLDSKGPEADWTGQKDLVGWWRLFIQVSVAGLLLMLWR